jgi:hypothetical protein
MKQLVNQNDKTIIDAYLGEIITVFCCRYIYTGKLIKIDSLFITLEDCKIVYETGDFAEKEWKDAQSLKTKEWNISLGSIEGLGKLDKC